MWHPVVRWQGPHARHWIPRGGAIASRERVGGTPERVGPARALVLMYRKRVGGIQERVVGTKKRVDGILRRVHEFPKRVGGHRERVDGKSEAC